MNLELIEALKLIEQERGVEADVIFSAIEESLVSAYKREVPAAKNNENIYGIVDRETGNMHIEIHKEIVEEVQDPESEIALSEAQMYSPDFELGDIISVMIPTDQLGRLAAQAAKSVINQRLGEAESEIILSEFSDRIGELAYGVVQRRDFREVIVDIGRAEAVLPKAEQSRLDNYDFNQRMRFYILKVDDRRTKPVVYVSRSHPNLVRRLFEQEVPEISNGIVEIVSVAREAGSRTKMAVVSHDSNVDAVGACVGQRGMRVQAVINELNGEKIDIIEWDQDLMVFLSNALSPSKVVQVVLYEEEKAASVVVPDHQLSLAIGREGQNARLAAKLTGWKIDIQSESQYHEMIEEELLSRFDQAVDQSNIDDEDHDLEAQDLIDSIEQVESDDLDIARHMEADAEIEDEYAEQIDSVTESEEDIDSPLDAEAQLKELFSVEDDED